LFCFCHNPPTNTGPSPGNGFYYAAS